MNVLSPSSVAREHRPSTASPSLDIASCRTIHLIAIPHKVDGPAQAPKQTRGRYASYSNAAHPSNGHVWQGRYDSCPLDQSHLWEALRYTEPNPVRAGFGLGGGAVALVSAACHCGAKGQDAYFTPGLWRSHGQLSGHLRLSQPWAFCHKRQ